MLERHAGVVTTSSAASGSRNGATLRVDDVLGMLTEAGYRCSTVPLNQIDALPTDLDLGVVVSYACVGSLRSLRTRARRTWLDAVDSWLLINGSGIRGGHPSYAARALRDAARLTLAPPADLVTYISRADLRHDRGTVRGARRLVLPGRAHGPTVGDDQGPRLVLVGDWSYGPNRDGLRWLRQRVVPLLPAPVHVYGRLQQSALSAGFLQHGYVSDDRDLYGQRDVHLAPVLSGGGVKRKVLQPLLAGLPVVTTTMGAHGLRPHPLLHVAHSADQFAALASRQFGRSAAGPPIPGEQVWDADDRPALLQWLRTDG